MEKNCLNCVSWTSEYGIIGTCSCKFIIYAYGQEYCEDCEFYHYEKTIYNARSGKKLDEPIEIFKCSKEDCIYGFNHPLTDWDLTEETQKLQEPKLDGKLVYYDGSGYTANFYTHKNFGCNHFVRSQEYELIEER